MTALPRDVLNSAFEEYCRREMPGWTAEKVASSPSLKSQKALYFAAFCAGTELYEDIRLEVVAELNKQAASRERAIAGRIRRQR